MNPLVVIPNYASHIGDVAMLERCLSSLRHTAKNTCDVLVVDDASPDVDITTACRGTAESFGAEFYTKEENSGFSATVNVGLRRALQEGRDAVLCNSDIEFIPGASGWLDLMVRQRAEDGEAPAAIVGALLLYPNNTIQHAGIYFSMLYREFDHIYRYGPANLPEARVARVLPVTGALQFIRRSTLEVVGVYDETFKLGWEDVDYNVRVWQAGLDIIYQPGVRAYHYEYGTRGQAPAGSKIADWQALSWQRFKEKWGTTNFAEFIPSLV